jgi:acyl carrier protein
MTQDLLPRILTVVGDIMGIPVETVSLESSPDTVASWDSLKHMNLVLALEKAFCVRFTGEDILEMMSVALIVEIVRQRLTHD